MAMTGDHVELNIGGTWTDITGDVYERDPISISRGMPDQGTQSDPGRCTLTLDNRSGNYSPRNPMGLYYGLIGRNTPLRVSVPNGTPYLSLDGSVTGCSAGAGAGHLTGDLDIRIDAECEWTALSIQLLAYRGSPNGSSPYEYMLHLDSGNVWLRTGMSDGTFASGFHTLPAGPLPNRMSLRVTWQKNVSGNVVYTFYTGTGGVNGPWVQFGQAIGAPIVLSSASSTEPVRVGSQFISSTGTVRPSMRGKVYAAKVLNGVGGTALASPDFTAQTAGALSFADSTGVAWATVVTAAIRDRVDRFVGEISSWPPKWDPSGSDAWTPVEASGILRRLGQGQKPLDSTLRRRIPSQPNLLAYWPMEEGTDATQATSPVDGVPPLKLNGVTWASNDTLASSAPLPVLASNGGALPELYGRVPQFQSPATAWLVRFVYKLDTIPSTRRTFMRVQTTGTVWEWLLQWGNGNDAVNGQSRILGRSVDGTVLVDQGITTDNTLFGLWKSVDFRAVQTATNTITWRIVWLDTNGTGGQVEVTTSGLIGQVSAVTSPADGYAAELDGLALGHIGVFASNITTAYDGAFGAYSGETATARMRRLATEESLPLIASNGDLSRAAEAVGPQRQSTVLDLLSECADADGGILYEDPGSLGLLYRDRASLYNQPPALTMDYSSGEVWAPFEPVDDDSGVTNDITVQRDGGSSFRAVLTDGSLSVNQAPDGIGLYSSSVTQSLAADDQTESHANWLLHLGTWDEARYPSVTVLLHAAPELIPSVLAVHEGDKIRITNLPKWVAPGDVDLLVDGYSETIQLDQWAITFNCRPAGPWNVGAVEDAVFGCVDTDASTLTFDATSTATALTVNTPAGPWVTSSASPTDFPFDANVGGEVATVSAIAPYALDPFTRTVSNGWGSTPQGTAWVPSGGSASDFSVNGSAGVITLAASPGTVRFQQILGAFTDCEILVAITPAQLATGDALVPGVLLRAATDFYRCRLFLGTSGSVGIDLTRDFTAVGSTATTPVTYAANTKLWFRVRITDQRVLARVWADGSPEPSLWYLDQTVTTSPIPYGAVGVTASAFGANTNVSPSFRYDDFQIVTPQTFTVTRSVNGIVKAQPAGTDIRLADPTIIAL